MIYDVAFISFVVLYFLISIKIDYWITVSLLGFSSETPELFLRHPKKYEFVRGAVFLLACLLALLSPSLSGFVVFPILFVAWIAAGKIGRKLSFRRYRNVMKEMLEYSNTEQEKNEIMLELKKTDSELMDKASDALKYSG